MTRHAIRRRVAGHGSTRAVGSPTRCFTSSGPVRSGASYPVTSRRGRHWFVPLQPLWRVERTFAWLGRNRHLRHDYEATVTSSQTFVHTAAVAFMLTRLNLNR